MRNFVLLCVLSSPVFAQQPAVVEKGSIEGVVINAATNLPVKKAQVNVQPMQGGGPGANVATDAAGHFTVEQLAPGKYAIRASHPAFPGSQMVRRGQSETMVTLKPGEHNRDISIALTPGVVISGKVTDEDGEPLQGCSVQPMQFNYQNGVRQLAPVGGASTNDRGEYRIFNLGAARYYVQAFCQRPVPATRPFAPRNAMVDYPQEAYLKQFYPGSGQISGATQINPPPGSEQRDISFRMRKVAAVFIRGRIAVQGADLEGSQIQIMLLPNNGIAYGTAQSRASRANGGFEFTAVTPGSYFITVTSPQASKPLFGKQDIEVGDSNIKDLIVPAYPSPDITGTIEIEPASQGQPGPINGGKSGRIWLRPVGLYSGVPQPNTEVKEDGSFMLPAVSPGVWSVQYQSGQMAYIKSIRLGDQDVSPYRLEITPSSAGPMRIVMGTNFGQIEGTIQADQPDANAGAAVLMVMEGEPVTVPNLTRITSADPQGHFKLQGVPPGRYRLYAVGNGSLAPDNLDLLKALESRSQEVTVEEGSRISKQLQLIPAETVMQLEKEFR